MLEGRLTGDDAEHVRTQITRCPVNVKLIVDLTEVVFIDDVGEQVLSFLGRLGALFVAPNSYALDVCERLNLSIAANGIPPESALRSSDANVRQSRPSAARGTKVGRV
ncbi:MAG TPA: hypothetical protein VLW83_08035 [Candidatus Acidoferrales bacterium]|nr:hypothetical protein [Candidatus Acidoferrales bacterium]